MATEQNGFSVTLPAGADLSAARYTAVELNASGQVTQCNAATDTAIGVLQNEPAAAGDPAEVMIVGITKWVADAAVTEGAFVGTSADGQAVAKSADTDIYLGIALDESTAAGQVIRVLITGTKHLAG